jgi:hypothetical protein
MIIASISIFFCLVCVPTWMSIAAGKELNSLSAVIDVPTPEVFTS